VSEQTAEALAGAVRAGSTGTSTSTTMAANEAAPALPASGAPGLSAVAATATSPPSGPMISPFAQPGVHRRVGEGTPASSTHASTTAGTQQQQQQQKPPPPVMDAASVDAALDEVRPYLLADGGDVNVVDVTDGVVRVALVGACSSCASSSATLKMGIERQLRAVFGDQLEQVLQVLLLLLCCCMKGGRTRWG
jgi:Fe-S cluster biogenesis protein NfuA